MGLRGGHDGATVVAADARGVEYRSFQLIGYPMGNPELVDIMKPVTEFRSNDFKILAFKLLGLKAGYTYELSWFYSRRSTVPH